MTGNSKPTESESLSTLGLSENATLEEASKAYRRLAAEYHPDRVAHLGEELQSLARERMAEINSAYAFLKDALPRTRSNGKSAGAGSIHDDVANGKANGKSRRVEPKNDSPPKPKIATVRFRCPNCNRNITVPETVRGKSGACTACRAAITVPTHMLVRCKNCSKKNKIPNVMRDQRAICRSCFYSLATAERID